MKAPNEIKKTSLKASGGTGRRVRKRGGTARPPRVKGRPSRASRSARVARFVRDGGTILSSGPVIEMALPRGWEWYLGSILAGVQARGARMRRVASRWKATVAAIKRARAARAAAAAAPVVPAVATAAGTLEHRLAQAREAGRAVKLSKAERDTLRAARRAARIAKGRAVASLRPVHALRLVDGAEHLGTLCEGAARRWVRLWEACGGRVLTPSDVEELGAIYHAQGAMAAVTCGVIPPDALCVWQWRGGDVLPAVALRAWRRALRAAGTACRAYLWGKGRERCEVVSTHDLHRLRAIMLGAGDERCFTVSSAQSCLHETPLVEELRAEARTGRVRGPFLRRLCARWGTICGCSGCSPVRASGGRAWRAICAG